MRYLAILLIVFTLGCSAEKKSIRAEKKIADLATKYPHLVDDTTIYKTDTVIRENLRIVENSVLKTNYDTVEVVKEQYWYQIVRLPGDSFRVEVEVPGDTVYVPTQTNVRTINVRHKAVFAELKEAERKGIRKGRKQVFIGLGILLAIGGVGFAVWKVRGFMA